MQLPAEAVLTLELAKGVADTCETGRTRRGFPLTSPSWMLAVTSCISSRGRGSSGDGPGSDLEGTKLGSLSITIEGDRSAVDEGLIGLVALPGMAPFEGAVPFTVGETVIGAVAVSGVTKEIDGEIAQAGADGGGSPPRSQVRRGLFRFARQRGSSG